MTDQITPPCWNRPPFADGRTLHGIDETTGKAITITLRNDWFEDRCRTWEGVGIGPPTPEYPSGTPYPIAHGWDKACATCRWLPAGALPASSFQADQVWQSPRGLLFRVSGVQVGGKAVLRQGADGAGSPVVRDWNDVAGWVLDTGGGA